MSQLTAQGFKRKRLDEVIAEMQQTARELWGANVNLSDRSNLGKFIKLIAGERVKDYEEMEDIYNNDFYDTAEGVNLDKAAKRIGLTRILEDYAAKYVEFGVDSTVTSLPKGMIVHTPDGIEFTTTETGTRVGGIVSVGIKALISGPSGNVPANTITEIKTPLPGVNSVTNPEATSGGRDKETDADFRLRYEKSLAIGGSSTTESIKAALLQMPDVKDAIVDENETDVDDETRGLPPNCVAPFVYGGLDADVAQTIFQTKAGGIRSFGQTVVPVTDSMGRTHQIGFSRPTQVPVWVRITLTKNGDYPTDGNSQITTAVVKHIGGVDDDGTDYTGLAMGVDVVRYKISNVAGAIPGIDDLVIETSLTGNGADWAQNNVSIGPTSIAITSFDKVVIV